jgi:hypothetical protein
MNLKWTFKLDFYALTDTFQCYTSHASCDQLLFTIRWKKVQPSWGTALPFANFFNSQQNFDLTFSFRSPRRTNTSSLARFEKSRTFTFEGTWNSKQLLTTLVKDWLQFSVFNCVLLPKFINSHYFTKQIGTFYIRVGVIPWFT